MTKRAVRLYALGLSLLTLFAISAAIAAQPWKITGHATPDARFVALAAREQRLHHESIRVRTVVARRYAVYRSELRVRRAAIARAVARSASLAASAAAGRASAPTVRVVALPPLTITRTS